MKITQSYDEKIARISFASVFPHYVAKVERKGRTKAELLDAIEWLTGYNEKDLEAMIEANVSFEYFFEHATMNAHAHLIKGVICGYRVEEISNPLTQQIRRLDKLVDDLAKGKRLKVSD